MLLAGLGPIILKCQELNINSMANLVNSFKLQDVKD